MGDFPNMNESNRASWGFVFIAVGAMLFGTIGVATKGIFTVSQTNGISITLWRVLIALPVFLAAGIYLLRARLFSIPRKDLQLMVGAGLVMAIYQLAFVLAVQAANVTIATLVTLCTVPVIVSVFASFLLHEQMRREHYIAMACAIAGVVLLVGSQPAGDFGSNVWFGIAMALLTALANGLFQITSRALANRYHPLQTLTVYFAVAALAFLPFALASGFVVTYPLSGWALLLHLGIVISVIAYFLLLLGLQTIPATTAAIIGFVEPLTGTILAILIFNEQLSLVGIGGAALLLTAMAIVWRTNPKATGLMTE
jgi:DME family drug/metabolite transporter